MTPKDLGLIRQGAYLQGVMPHLEEAIAGMEAQLEGRVFRLMDDGKLTPELAQMAWMEKLAYRRLLRRFDQKVRIGQAAGAMAAPELSGEPPLPI